MGEESGKGKRKRNSGFPQEAGPDEPKRTRVHAQRKFAQGAGGASPHVSPHLIGGFASFQFQSSTSLCGFQDAFLPCNPADPAELQPVRGNQFQCWIRWLVG